MAFRDTPKSNFTWRALGSGFFCWYDVRNQWTGQAVEALIDYFDLPSSRIQQVEALALSAQTSTQHFIQNHTLIPAIKAISANFGGICHGEPGCSALFKTSWGALQKPAAYFCPQCAIEQQNCWGFSYWQRHHQLTGVNWCSKHLCPLLGCPKNLMTSTMPDLDLATVTTNRIEATDGYWPVLKRYAAIMHGFLRRDVSASRSDVVRILSAVANKKAAYRGVELLSDIAVTQLPDWWLAELFPSIYTKKLGVPFSPLDNTILSGNAPSHAFALAMALLYRSSKHALAEMPTNYRH